MIFVGIYYSRHKVPVRLSGYRAVQKKYILDSYTFSDHISE
jgi:hypothetical protein